MADKEIGDLTDGGAAQAGDVVHAVRGANSRKVALGTAAGKAATEFATSTQGGKADSAVQPDDLGSAAEKDLASAADLRAAATDKVVGADVALSAMDWVALTDAGTIAVDHAAGVNRKVTLGGNRAFGAPSNAKTGWPLNIWVVQDGTGGRVPTWNAAYDFGDYGTPTLSTGAGQADLVTFVCLTSNKFAFLGIRKRVD